MKVSDLSPHPANPRKISDVKMKMLEKSLKEFGDLSGIIFNKKTGRLIGGHQRIQVLPKDAEIENGFIIVNGDKFTYREVEWDETKEKAANIASNQHGGEWDLPKLTDWINELDALNIDMDLLGFDEDELSKLMAPVKNVGQCDEDEVPEVKEPKAKRGDIYQLGNHRLMCGDSTCSAYIDDLMDGKTADITFTSPPYNAGFSAKLRGNTSIDDNLYGEGYDDNKSEDEWLSLVSAATVESVRVSRYQFWNIQFLAGNSTALPRYWAAFSNHIVDVAIWDKGHAQPAAAERVLDSRFEFVFIFTSDEKPTRAIRCAPAFRGTIQNVFEIAPQRSNEFANIHAATFPVAFPEMIVDKFCPIKGSCLDLFGGTGTTLIACEKTGRRCFMMEIDPHYVDVICARWENFTGKKASLVTGDGAGNAESAE